MRFGWRIPTMVCELKVHPEQEMFPFFCELTGYEM